MLDVMCEPSTIRTAPTLLQRGQHPACLSRLGKSGSRRPTPESPEQQQFTYKDIEIYTGAARRDLARSGAI